VFFIYFRKEYAMKKVLSLFLVVVLIAAVLAPVAAARAVSWKWNAAKTQRTFPDGTTAVLRIPYSHGAKFREREVTLVEPKLAKLGITVEHSPMDFNAMRDANMASTFIVSLHGISFSNYDAFGSVFAFRSDQSPLRRTA
jgi:hypothetical protein